MGERVLNELDKPKRGYIPEVMRLDMTRVQTDDGTLYRATAKPLGGRYVAVVDYGAMERELMREADQNANKPPKGQSAPPSQWLGDGEGNLDAAEMRLLRQSLRLQPRDISTALAAVGRDAPPGIVSRWEQNSQYGPPREVCDFLWACDRAVDANAAQVLEYAIAHRSIPDRHGGKAVEQFEGMGLEKYGLIAEAFQSLQVAAWDRAILILRARGLTLDLCRRV
jgi:hypothetical protein